jgi:two-component system NarL family sensor kinase
MAESQATQIYLIVAVGIVTMLLMSGAIILFIVFYQKRMIVEQLKRRAMEHEFQEKMLQAELESQETERRRLAADLHDSIGGMLSTIRVGMATMARQLGNPESMDQTKQMLDDTITSVRRISRDLMPSTLEKFGLIHALRELCERFQNTSGIQIDFIEEGRIEDFEKNRQLMIFRIVQELLNNAIKHAQATRIVVHLKAESVIGISVEDDGVGFDAEAVKKDAQNGRGLGLFNIENRARLLGGKIVYASQGKSGSKTTLTIPPDEPKNQSLHR